MKNFDFFKVPGKPVTYISVIKNEALDRLHKLLVKKVDSIREERSPSKPYMPHFTIGYRDKISPDLFAEIQKAYSHRQFTGSFICNEIYLWKRYNDRWNILETFKFGSNSGNEPEYGQLELF